MLFIKRYKLISGLSLQLQSTGTSPPKKNHFHPESQKTYPQISIIENKYTKKLGNVNYYTYICADKPNKAPDEHENSIKMSNN